jgi:hypothetical protein
LANVGLQLQVQNDCRYETRNDHQGIELVLFHVIWQDFLLIWEKVPDVENFQECYDKQGDLQKEDVDAVHK